jgi:hypothetical protein
MWHQPPWRELVGQNPEVPGKRPDQPAPASSNRDAEGHDHEPNLGVAVSRLGSGNVCSFGIVHSAANRMLPPSKAVRNPATVAS